MGTFIGILFILSGLPQTIKLLRSKDSASISVITYIVTVLAIYLTLFQAIADESWQVAISMTMSASITTTNLILIYRYRYVRKYQ
jgi:uncharacterized protein with PQ loop repeat